jgi:hypothetical protein
MSLTAGAPAVRALIPPQIKPGLPGWAAAIEGAAQNLN